MCLREHCEETRQNEDSIARRDDETAGEGRLLTVSHRGHLADIPFAHVTVKCVCVEEHLERIENRVLVATSNVTEGNKEMKATYY